MAKLLGVAVLILAAYGVYWYVGMEGYKRGQAEMTAKQNETIITATKANDALKQQLEIDHAKANAALNVILATPAPRVRIPSCPAQPIPSVTDQLPITAIERADDRGQQILDRARERLELKAAEWSRALNACNLVFEWAKKSPQ